MPKHYPFLLLFLLGFSVLLKSQIKPHLRLQPRLFTELQKPFSKKRSAGFNARFNHGVGFDAEILVSNKMNPSSKFVRLLGVSAGQYLFWNNQVKNFDYPFPYHENNLVSAFTLCFKYSSLNHRPIFTPKEYSFTFELRVGMAYIQSEITNLNSGFTKIYPRWGNTFSIYIGGGKLFKIGKNFWFPLYYSIGYINIGGKHLGGFFAI